MYDYKCVQHGPTTTWFCVSVLMSVDHGTTKGTTIPRARATTCSHVPV